MASNGPDFYDNEAVYATYLRHRQRSDSPNETLEKPVILQLIGSVAGKRVVDLGCGDAAIAQTVLQQGARSYLGIEGSQQMAALAKETLAGSAGQVVRQSIEEWHTPADSIDLILARLSLHYIENLSPVFTNVFQALTAGGRFVFSVEHPVITSCDRGWPAGTQRQDWLVDDYFSTGLRVTNWLGGSVQKYHRTIEDYMQLLLQAGFQIADLREANPQPEYFNDPQTFERRKRIPLFLILAARKPF